MSNCSTIIKRSFCLSNFEQVRYGTVSILRKCFFHVHFQVSLSQFGLSLAFWFSAQPRRGLRMNSGKYGLASQLLLWLCCGFLRKTVSLFNFQCSSFNLQIIKFNVLWSSCEKQSHMVIGQRSCSQWLGLFPLPFLRLFLLPLLGDICLYCLVIFSPSPTLPSCVVSCITYHIATVPSVSIRMPL